MMLLTVLALLSAVVSATSKEHRSELVLIGDEKIGEVVKTPRPHFDAATLPDHYDLRSLGLLTTDLNQVSICEQST